MRDECSCGDREEVEGGGGSAEGSEQGGAAGIGGQSPDRACWNGNE